MVIGYEVVLLPIMLHMGSKLRALSVWNCPKNPGLFFLEASGSQGSAGTGPGHPQQPVPVEFPCGLPP